MKLSPPVTIVALIVIAFASMTILRHRQQTDLALKCRVTLAALQDELARVDENTPVVVSERPDYMVEDAHEPGWIEELERWRKVQWVELPSTELLLAFRSQAAGRPMIKCPSIAAWLDARGITHSDKLVTEVWRESRSSPDGHFSRAIVYISVAALSSDRSSALVATGTAYGSLGGNGYFAELVVQPDGRITLKRRYTSWQS